jgi:hypothetical protein
VQDGSTDDTDFVRGFSQILSLQRESAKVQNLVAKYA